jgi:N-acetyl-anhydromuramoyl-L-alanine amidase
VFAEIDAPSPNFAERPPHEQRGVCFHHTVMSFEETLAYMARAESRVSYHVVIARNGTRARLVEETAVAWHAGVSSFQGRENANAFLLGVAFAGDTYAMPLTEAQIASALEWLGQRWVAQGWQIAVMTDHRQIAPGRKDDLEPHEWKRLQAAIELQFGA